MRAWYVDRRNDPILDVRMIVTFACALVLVLIWLLPREEFFRQMLAEGKADHVSIAYARLLVSLYPDDVELRLLLAGQYHQIGELDLAWAAIDSSDMPPSVLRATLILEMAYASGQGAERKNWEQLLEAELLAGVSNNELDEKVLGAFANAAFAINQPQLAAQFFERRFLAEGDAFDLEQAVKAWRQADKAGRAADLFAIVDGSVSETIAELALDTYLAAGMTEAGFEFIDRWLEQNDPGPGLTFRFIEFAQFADAPERMKQYLALLDDAESLSGDQLLRLAGAAIAIGELELAATYMQQVLLNQPDALDLRQELAQVYRWGGKPEQALEQWLYLVEQTGEEDFVADAWVLAQGLYRYETSSYLLTRLASLRRLTDEEVAALRTAYELRGLPDQGIAALTAYLERHPAHRFAWLQLIGLQKDNEYLQAASESLAAFAAIHRVSVKERLQWADLLWERYLTEEAVELMLAAGKPDDPEYWLRLSSYAWFLDDMTLVAHAYASLLEIQDHLEQDQYERFILALTYTDRPEALRQAVAAWNSLRNPAFFVQALQWAIETGDPVAVETLLAEAAEDMALLEGSSEFWELLAFHYQRTGNQLAVLEALERALVHHPRNLHLITAYVWALIQSDDQPGLESALREYAGYAELHSELWSAFASGYARLGDHRVAAAWFALAASMDKADLEVLLAYAGSLEAMGMMDPAFRIRRYVIAEMAAGRTAAGFGMRTISTAGDGILSAQNQQALAAYLAGQAHPAFHPDRLPTLYLAQALRSEHFSAARYWLQVDPEADVWQKLSIAAETQDQVALAGLLDHRDPEVRIQAALAMDLPVIAYRQAREEPRYDEQALQGIASSYYARYPSGWQVEPGHAQLSGLAIDAATLRVAGRVGDSLLGTTLAAFQLTDASRLMDRQIDERYLDLELSRRNRFGDATASLSILDSMGQQIPGFTASQLIRLDRRNSLQIDAGYQQLTEITALARAVAQRSGVRLSWEGNVSRRDRLHVATSWDQYLSRFGGKLGQGNQLEVRYDHALLFGSPQVRLGSSFYRATSSVRALDAGLEDRLQPGLNERLLPEETNRLAVNASVSRGYPGDLRWDFPGPRFRLGAAVGYQWPENAPTLEFEASAGIRVLGNDELSVKTAYTSALLSGVGGEGYRASLVYSKRLGR